MRRRIIPARAGFTLGDFPPLLSPGDHPRSRGVYAPAVVSMLIRVGSSPLARGLPIIQRRAIADGGIIPARAGFTLVEGGSVYDVKDHPRSRGVYYFVRLPRSSEIGSSPLARGLPVSGTYKITIYGIIPARAGFTSTHWVEGTLSLDHPRSRGVYGSSESSPHRRIGSSPLARGLHGRLIIPAARRGIIPARAGFTRENEADRAGLPDHPRSRGVYKYPNVTHFFAPGSSPLARGLLDNAGVEIRVSRIIPARAGFTDAEACNPSARRDHPRSRGVYYA